jgi:hypothetical protein
VKLNQNFLPSFFLAAAAAAATSSSSSICGLFVCLCENEFGLVNM